MKIFKFRRLVQRKLLLSPLRPTAERESSAPTFRPPFRQLSPPELHPSLAAYLPFRAVYSASGYSNAVAIISFRLGLVVHHRWAAEPLSLFFPFS